VNSSGLAAREPAPGQRLGRYELLLLLARGGMAQVWAARLRGPRGFRKLVAIKVIWRGTLDDARFEDMLLQEATLACQIHHPNVVETLELGEDEGMLHLAMEWIDGEALSAILSASRDHGGIPLDIAVNLVGQVCRGLQAAHDLKDDAGSLLGLVHRDVSPQNILVSYAGVAKIVDFGIAKATSQASSLTAENEVKGKFAYIAPEQVRGQAVDRRTDLFSLGVVLYNLTTGKHPFKGATPAQTVAAVCSPSPPAPPSSFVEDYPDEIEVILLKAMAKAPEDRFASAKEMLHALELSYPSAFESGFEDTVAKFMAQLFENRSADRRAAIRLAEDLAEKTSPTGITPIGTLEGVSQTHAGVQAHPAFGLGAGVRRNLIAAAALVLLGLGALLLSRPGAEAKRVSLDPSLPAPAVTLETRTELEPAAPVPTPARPPAVANAESSPPASLEQRSSSPSAGSAPRSTGSLRARVPSGAGVGTAAMAPATVTTAGVTTSGAATTASGKPNAWDPNVFGGRN